MRKRPVLITLVSLLALTGCKQKVSPEEAAAHLKTAEDLYAKKDYGKALSEVQSAIAANPQSGDAHYLAAQIQEGLGNQRGAFEEYARAAVPDANNLKAQLKVAEILIDAKQLGPALGRVNGTLGSHPDNPDALALRALIEQRQGSTDKARGDAQAALGKSPGQPIAISVLAAEALTAQNTDKALELIAAGLKVHPDDVSLQRLQAAAMMASNKPDDAIAIYEKLVKEEPDSVRDRAALAELEAKAGRVDDGEKVIREGVAAAPKSPEMRMVLVGYLDRYRDSAAADAALKDAITANPQDSTFDLLRADHLLRTGHADQAGEALRAAITRIPEGSARQAAEIGLAKLDVEQGDSADARKLLDQVVAAKADNDDALLLRARLMLRDDDAAHAIPDLLAVAGRQPRSVTTFGLLADAYVQLGDYEKAADALKKVVYFQPNDLTAAVRLVEVELKAKKPDLAKASLTDFNARNPESVDGRVALVRLLLQQKDFAGAQSAIDSLRRLPKGDRAVVLLNAQLDESKGQPERAMAGYLKQLDADPSKPLDRDALQGYARSAVAAKQTDQAISTVSALAGRLSGADQAVADLVSAALNQAAGKPDQAIAAVNGAIAAAPKDPAAYLQLAALRRESDPKQAIAALDQGLAAGAAAEPLLLARAALEDQAGDKTAAVATYREALNANPQSIVAANNYGSLVADALPNDKAALEAARQPVQRFADSTNPAMLDTLAWLDYRLGDLQTAKTLLLRAKADTSPNPQLRYHYGAVLIALGDKENGRAVVKAALAQPFPGHAEAEKLLTD